jgi:AraC-like DNA-binding protein
MGRPIPMYRNHDQTFQADACLPLADAARRGEICLRALVHGHYPGRKLPAAVLPGLETGSLKFAVDDREYVLKPGDLTVTRPWQRHRVGDPNIGASRLHWLILDVGVRRPEQNWRWPEWLLLDAPDLHALTDILRHTEKAVWRASADIRRCFVDVAQAVERNRGSISRLAVRLNELFLLLLDLCRQQPLRLDRSLSSSRHTVQLFLADLRSHPEHPALEWNVDEMARSCGLGTTQFAHHVYCLTNMTPIHYLNNCRLDLAAKLLCERSGVKVTDIALDCGFSSSQYFATVFRRRFGCSPGGFRRSGRAEPQPHKG